MMTRFMFFTLWICLMALTVEAKVQTKTITYAHGEVTLEGYVAWDDTVKGERPGVLVVHEWWGLNEYIRDRVEQLAGMGYVAFAADMYGKGQVTTHPDQARIWVREIQGNVGKWQARARKGLEVLKTQPFVDADRTAAIGYCFGGATVMQLAYSGANVQGVVSFHGSLPIPNQQDAANTKAKILIAHGNADPFLEDSHVLNFRNALDQAKLDWQMIIYAGARHSFTNPDAGAFGISALEYNQKADRRSWAHMKGFFAELFH